MYSPTADYQKLWTAQNTPLLEKQRKTAEATIEADSATELAQRNEAAAARQNASMQYRDNTRVGGGRYKRRGLLSVSSGGLAAANSKSLMEARKKAAYAQLEESAANQMSSDYNARVAAVRAANARNIARGMVTIYR